MINVCNKLVAVVKQMTERCNTLNAVVKQQQAEILRLEQREKDLLEIIRQEQVNTMLEWDIVDVKNAKRLLVEFCESRECRGCPFADYEKHLCKVRVPRNWWTVSI